MRTSQLIQAGLQRLKTNINLIKIASFYAVANETLQVSM